MSQTPLRRDFDSRADLVAYLHHEFADIVGDDDTVSPTIGGRAAAERQLATINPVRYAATRNALDGAVTRLSAYIRHGVLSLAEVRDAVWDRIKYASEGEKRRLLLFSVGGGQRMASALEEAARLEEFAAEQIEMSGHQRVVQYRDDILPLISLAEHFGRREADLAGQPLPVVVVREGERSYGLVVERILDIVEQELKVQRRAPRAGLLGTAVIGGKVTDLLDIAAVVKRFASECETHAV